MPCANACHRVETPRSSSGNLGLITPPHAAVACEGFCGLAVYNEIRHLWNAQLWTLEQFLNEPVAKIRQVKPLDFF